MPPTSNAPTNQLNQLAEKLGSVNNVLITVSNNPSVDQLASCIGLTLALNKLGKHATAVFSGKVPSTLEFLQPEKTIETNTNSLRDFIISLDKSKADKLRYKVEDDFVKIFITPYRTSIDEKDLNFSQGDFNIDLIIALGVHDRSDLDGAIVAHGRILHDATVASVNNISKGEFGSINWIENEASSLCEMVSDLIGQVDKGLFDQQIATALLTGMVAETDRFGNEKARPHTMSVSGVLMAAGASPQLISSKLQTPEPETEEESDEPTDEIPPVVEEEENEADEASTQDGGMIEIDHKGDSDNSGYPEHSEPNTEESETEENEPPTDDIIIDEQGRLKAMKELEDQEKARSEEETPDRRSLILEPPKLTGQLTANTVAEHQQYSPSTDPLSNVSPAPLLERTNSPKEESVTPPENTDGDRTLTEIERSVNSLHLEDPKPAEADVNEESSAAVPPPPPVDDARAIVDDVVEKSDTNPSEPVNSFESAPEDPNPEQATNSDTQTGRNDTPDSERGSESADQPEPSADEKKDSNTPPPVPPPLMPPGV